MRHAEVLEHGELGRPPAAHRQGHRLLPARRRAPGGAGAERSPSTASATPRSAGVPERPRRRRRGRRRRLRPAADRLVRARPTRCSTGSTRTSSGACAATSSTCRPTARSATSGSAGPATSRSSRPPPASCSTAPASSTSWLADLAAEQQPDGSVPFVVPDVIERAAPAAAAWGDAATIVPWVLYQRTGDVGLLAGSCRACAPGSTRSPSWPAPTASGPAASSSATGSTRPRRRTTPSERPGRPGRGRHGPPGPLGRGRRPGRGRGRRRRRGREVRSPGRRGPGRLRARVRDARRAGAQRRPDGVRPGARSGRCCRPPTSATTPATAWPTWCGRRASGSAPASSARR